MSKVIDLSTQVLGITPPHIHHRAFYWDGKCSWTLTSVKNYQISNGYSLLSITGRNKAESKLMKFAIWKSID